MNIIEAIEDKHLFGQLFKDPASWAAWRVFLRGLFALPMTAEELATFKEFTGRTKAPEKPAAEAFAIVGRRGGKSFISAIVACFLAVFHDWRPYLTAGETGYVMIIATDRIQARVIFSYIRAILALKMFKNQVEKELTEEIRIKNSITISVKTCDFRTIRGFTCVAAICDELAYWRSEGLNPAGEILTALRPALATVKGSLLLGISSPYNKTGPLYEGFRSKWGDDASSTLIWKAPTLAMNPTINPNLIDSALRDDYNAARAEWLSEFRDDVESFLTVEMIEGATVAGRWQLPPADGVAYQAFVDPSGGRADSFTLGISHLEESGRVVLDRLEERKPPLAPQDVAREYAEIMKQYGCWTCQGDKYAGEWVVKAFADNDISYQSSPLTKSEIYLEALPLLTQRRIDLLDNKTLFAELRGLERKTRSGGRDSVDHYQGGHDDAANAAAGAAVMAARLEGIAGADFIILGGPDDDWGREMILQHNQPTQPPPDPPEIAALCNEDFIVRYLAHLQAVGTVSAIAPILGVDEAVLRRWSGLKRGIIESTRRLRRDDIEKAAESMTATGQ